MFIRKNRLRKDLPAIDIRKKPVRGLFGKTKWVAASRKEKKKMKAVLMEQYPDRYYMDDLNEWNSTKQTDDLSWIDDLEMMEAMMDD